MQRPFVTRLVLPLLLCLCGVAQVHAETRYVTDKSEIMMRKGETTKHRIIRALPSGEAVEELAVNEASGYSQIRTEDGTTGYVLTHQLQDEPVARERVAELEARLAQLEAAPDQLATKLADLEAEHKTLLTSHEDLQREKDQLEQELASIRYASENVMRISQERTELRASVANLTGRVADLQQENLGLKNQASQRWFMIGAGAVAGGILLGLILPNLRLRRRKSSWGSL